MSTDPGAPRLEALCRTSGAGLAEMVGAALAHVGARQLPDGSLVDDPEILIFQEWDTVNALKAMGTWADRFEPDTAVVDAAFEFLAGREKPTGMLSWGVLETTPGEYCTETSSEYIAALTLFGRRSEALAKAGFLREQQLPNGAWAEVHSHIPNAFQTEASVTGFALAALFGLDLDPAREDEAVEFLAGAQRPDGHFGLNWYYYSTYYYLMRPAVAALVEFGHHSAVAHARDFVLAEQRPDGSWYTEVDGFGAYSSPEQHTALALQTLSHAGVGLDHPAVHRALSWLFGRRHADGGWDGGSYPYPETGSYRSFRATQHIFTTTQVLAALHRFAALEANG